MEALCPIIIILQTAKKPPHPPTNIKFSPFLKCELQSQFNPLVPELFFLILAHLVYKMWIIKEPNKLALWNKLHFEEKKTESIEYV